MRLGTTFSAVPAFASGCGIEIGIGAGMVGITAGVTDFGSGMIGISSFSIIQLPFL